MAELVALSLLSSPAAACVLQGLLGDALGNTICTAELQAAQERREKAMKDAQARLQDPKTPKASEIHGNNVPGEQKDSKTPKASEELSIDVVGESQGPEIPKAIAGKKEDLKPFLSDDKDVLPNLLKPTNVVKGSAGEKQWLLAQKPQLGEASVVLPPPKNEVKEGHDKSIAGKQKAPKTPKASAVISQGLNWLFTVQQTHHSVR